jgi:hypothetical protein
MMAGDSVKQRARVVEQLVEGAAHTHAVASAAADGLRDHGEGKRQRAQRRRQVGPVVADGPRARHGETARPPEQVVDVLLVIVLLDGQGALSHHVRLVLERANADGRLQRVVGEEDRVGPKVGDAPVERLQDALFGIRKTPVRVCLGLRAGCRADHVDALDHAEVVGDVSA